MKGAEIWISNLEQHLPVERDGFVYFVDTSISSNRGDVYHPSDVQLISKYTILSLVID